jgi:hypothetical protein
MMPTLTTWCERKAECTVRRARSESAMRTTVLMLRAPRFCAMVSCRMPASPRALMNRPGICGSRCMESPTAVMMLQPYSTRTGATLPCSSSRRNSRSMACFTALTCSSRNAKAMFRSEDA